MTKIVHPYAHRLGIFKDWQSRWMPNKFKYSDYLKNDHLIRVFLKERLKNVHISSIQIECSDKELKVIVSSSRIGFILGKDGKGVENLKNNLMKVFRKNKRVVPKLVISLEEIRLPENDSSIVASMIAENLKKRIGFKRVMKSTMERIILNKNIKGARIALSGRLDGAEMSRKEGIKRGRIPLQTFRADIDYTCHKVVLAYGVIGIKVWLYKGDVYKK